MLQYFLTMIKILFHSVMYSFNGKCLSWWPPSNCPVVTVRQGKLCGMCASLPNGSRYHYFKGVPYAKPPVGPLRFMPPVPLERFDSPVVKCMTERSECIQESLFGRIVGSENCLFMNIYAPDFISPGEKKYPVMIFIHGGGFIAGNASGISYNPIYFVQEGVIVVSMNYRLGPLGFLSFPSAGVAGNAGLKDQRLVFKWVHENISQFGGDPNNVTLFGESAGSISTYLHYLSPSSRKYFHRVICQSGIPCTETFFQTSGDTKARKLAKTLGYKGDSDKKALETLLKAPAKMLIKNQIKSLTSEEKRIGVLYPFMPVIEDLLSEDNIITQTPEEILKSADTLDIPLIEGCNSGDGILALVLLKGELELANKQPDRFVPQLLGDSKDIDRTEVGKEIKKFYFGDKKVQASTYDLVSDAMGDNLFITNSMINAEWLAKYQPKVTHYHYRFTFYGRYSFAKRLLNQCKVNGACHGDELFYMFSAPFLPHLTEECTEVFIRKTFLKLWTNFAKYGEPTPDGHNPFAFKWEPVAKLLKSSSDFELDCLEVDAKPRMIKNPCPERIKFWKKMLNQYRNGYL